MSLNRPSTRPLARAAATVGTGVAAGALLVAGATSAHAQLSSTTVEPAGDYLRAEQSGTGEFSVGDIVVSCDTGLSERGSGDAPEVNQIPQAPDNHNPSGPVGGLLSAPVFDDCDVNLALMNADVVTTPGEWEIEIQYGTPSLVRLAIPPADAPGGINVHITGLTSCDIAVVPGDQPHTIEGEWVPGDPGQIVFTDAAIPIEGGGGFGCPGTDDSLFTATFDVHNQTDPASPVTVTE